MYPVRSVISINSRSNTEAPGCFPNRTLVAISQADAADTKIKFRVSDTIFAVPSLNKLRRQISPQHYLSMQ